jgi:hypothetical protein
MVLQINTLSGQPPKGASLVADRELLLSADKSQVFEEGDPAGSFLLAAAGGVIPAAEVKRLGLSVREGRVGQFAPEPEAKPTQSAKELAKPEDKQRKKPADKAVKKPATKRRSKRRT